MLEHGPQGLQVQSVYGVAEDHAVGVAHRQTSDGVLLSAHGEGTAYHRRIGGDRQVGGVEAGPAHIHGHRADLSVPDKELQVLHAAAGLHADVFAAHIALVEHVLGHAAQVVAGNGAFAAVLIEGTHLHIGNAAALHEDYAIAADAVMGAAEADAQGLGTADAVVKILDEYIVVAAALHLGELYPLPPQAHGVDVHQLRILLGKAAGNNVRQSHGGIQGGKAGYAQLHGPPVQSDVVAHGGVLHGSGVYDVAQFAAFHQRAYFIALGGIGQGGDRQAQGAYGFGSAGGGVELQTQLVEAPGQGHDLLIVAVLHAYQHAAAQYLVAGGKLET